MLNSYQLVAVADDIVYLAEHWRDGAAGDELRRGSAVLRRLLVEQELLAAWGQLGIPGHPTVRSVDLELMIEGGVGNTMAAVAGGARIGRHVFAGAMLEGPFDSPEQAPKRDRATHEIERVFRLADYVESPCAIADGETVSRREVVKYFANHLGGVHLSRKARKTEEPMVRRLQRVQGLFQIHGLEGLHHEILAIGQATGEAPDIQRLVAEIRRNVDR